MRDFENESYRLGIPLRTRHNEVAPAQFECAPIFEEINIAVDHNTLLMDIMTRVAKRHNLLVLLHEKPFAGINGSGKHNNWSMSTDTGVNLLAPGKTPKTNLMFLTFFVNSIKAVHDYAELIRASIASAGNDHRLGANEAPPAIISIFIGKYLTHVLDQIEQRVGGNFDEADADAIANAKMITLALETSTGTKKMMIQGFYCKTAWNWTVGADLFLSTTLGTITETAPSGTDDVVVILGTAMSADTIYFAPSKTYITRA
jgi:glutamine synthetase type III